MFKRLLSKYLITLSGKPLGQRLSSVLTRIIYIVENASNHDIRTNGELRVYQELTNSSPGIIFDVGANKGEWTKEILAVSDSDTTIHAFEIMPSTFEQLSQNITDSRVVLNQIGLSDKIGEVDIHYYPVNDTGSSIVRLPWATESEILKCQVTTGDEYCTSQKVEKIDFLKIDAEGMDYSILVGFQDMLSSKKIKSIQFEYNKSGVLTKKMLKDFYDLLTPFGYKIGRIYPHSTNFKEYNLFKDETLLQGNYLAVLEG